MNFRFFPVIIAIVIGLTGCAKRFDKPFAFEDIDQNFSSSYRGIGDIDRGASPLRMMWLHGMCSTGTGFIASRRGIVSDWMNYELISTDFTEFGHIDVWKYTMQSPNNGDIVYLDIPIYSDYTTFEKFQLGSIEDIYLSDFGSADLINDVKRGLVNDCLVDPIFYAGSKSLGLRDDFSEYLCEFLGGSYDNMSGGCSGVQTDRAPVLVAESLGSKVMLDAWAKLLDRTQGRSDKARISGAFNSVSSIYLLSNQLTLLSASGAVGQRIVETGPIERLAGDQIAGKSSSEALEVVAFSDPNDLLSFALTRQAAGARESDRIINVMVSNGYSYGGKVVNPVKAHTSYHENPSVLAGLFCGDDGVAEYSSDIDC